jgi:IclR family transcriptional regulator, acetate operon repressor
VADRDPVGHSVALLRWLAEHEQPSFGVRELALDLGMQPSTVSRLLNKLVEERLVHRDSNGSFALGLEMSRLGSLATKKLDVRAIARPMLEQITAACNETSILGLYDSMRGEMVRVLGVNSTHPLAYVVRMNEWTQIYNGASGLGILAFLPEAEQAVIVKRAVAAATPETPWLQEAALSAELAAIAERGYARTHGQRVPGAVSISAPIIDGTRTVIGDVILTLPEFRADPAEEPELAKLVVKAASAISDTLAGRVST